MKEVWQHIACVFISLDLCRILLVYIGSKGYFLNISCLEFE